MYHINIVDEVTQWEYIGAVEKISEAHLVPLLVRLINQYPFAVLNFTLITAVNILIVKLPEC